MFEQSRLAQIGFCFLFLLTSCGGGGGGSTTTTNPVVSGVTIVPGLGMFSEGARVEAFDPVTGLSIGTAGTTGATGQAVIDLGTHASAFILKVTGSASAKYFEEGLGASGADTSFSSNDVLLALVPASAAVDKSATLGVTPLTHMAAGFAVNSLSDLKINVPQGKTAADVMYDAISRTRFITGLEAQSLDRAKIHLNPLIAPTLLSSANKSAGINISTAGGYNGLFLAELSKAVSNEGPARSSLDLAKSLFNRAAAIKVLVDAGTLVTLSQPLVDLQNSLDYSAITQATAAVGSGTSTFLNLCKTMSDAVAINAAFTNANTLNVFNPSAAQLAQMKLDLTYAIDTKIIKALAVPFTASNTGANGCT